MYVQNTGRPCLNVYTYFLEDGEGLGSRLTFSTVLCVHFSHAAACALVNMHGLCYILIIICINQPYSAFYVVRDGTIAILKLIMLDF